MKAEYYFEARGGEQAVFIGHVAAVDDDQAHELARKRYPDAVTIEVSRVAELTQ